MRNIWNPRQQLLKFLVQRARLLFQRGDPIADFAQFLLLLRSIHTLLSQSGYACALRVPPRFQLFRLMDRGAAARVQIAKGVEIRRIRAGRQTRGNGLEISPEIPQIVHFSMLTHM